ncbi:MAG: hypothetical protein ACYC6Y_26520 [Thermoguttaceae bacterium]
MPAQLQSLAALAVIAVAAYGCGEFLLQGLRLSIPDRFDRFIFAMTVGLVAAGTGLAVLGLLGLLYAPMIGVLTLAAAFGTLGRFFSARGGVAPGRAGDLDAPADTGESSCDDAPGWILWFAAAVSVVAALGSLAGALAPPTAGDALCYHLELPKAFLAGHRLAYDPYSENSTFPLLVEMLYLWAMALDGPVAAGLVHWLAGLLLAGSAVVLAAPVVGRHWAWIAGSIVLVVPGVTNQMTAPLNDLGLALMTTVALAAWWRGVMLDEGRRWLIVAGIAAGGALATKYLALVFAAAMAAGCVWVACRGRARRQLVLESIAVVAVIAASTAGAWYVRAAWHRGNPVYPFLGEVFVQQGPAGGAVEPTLPESKSRLGRTAWGPLTAAWQVTMKPDGLGGRGHQPGVIFLAFLPGLLLVRRHGGLGTLLVFGVAYWLAWYLLRQNVRFLLPVVPVGAVAVAWVIAEMRRFPLSARWAGMGLACGILAAYAGVAAVRCHDQLAVAVGLESRVAYLARSEPTWEAAAISNATFGRAGRLLSLDHRAYYFECPVTRESVYRRQTEYARAVRRPEELPAVLRKAGFSHLLLCENCGEQGAQFDPILPRLVADCRQVQGDRSFPVLWQYTFADADGAQRRYQLVLVR